MTNDCSEAAVSLAGQNVLSLVALVVCLKQASKILCVPDIALASFRYFSLTGFSLQPYEVV